MTSNPAESIAQLRSLQFPPVFDCIQKNEGIPTPLKSFRSPQIFYSALNKSSVHPEAIDWLPLWERFGYSLYAYDIKRKLYLIFDYSSKQVEVIAQTYQQFVTYVLFHVAENGGWDELEELASAFSYHYLDKLKLRFNEETDLDFETNCRQVVSGIEQS